MCRQVQKAMAKAAFSSRLTPVRDSARVLGRGQSSPGALAVRACTWPRATPPKTVTEAFSFPQRPEPAIDSPGAFASNVWAKQCQSTCPGCPHGRGFLILAAVTFRPIHCARRDFLALSLLRWLRPLSHRRPAAGASGWGRPLASMCRHRCWQPPTRLSNEATSWKRLPFVAQPQPRCSIVS
jgi:hypothetical protein